MKPGSSNSVPRVKDAAQGWLPPALWEEALGSWEDAPEGRKPRLVDPGSQTEWSRWKQKRVKWKMPEDGGD